MTSFVLSLSLACQLLLFDAIDVRKIKPFVQQPAGTAIAAATPAAGATAYTIPQYATTRYIQATPASQAAAAAQIQTGIAYTAATGAVAAPQQLTYAAAGTPLLDPYQQAALPNTYGVSFDTLHDAEPFTHHNTTIAFIR